MLKSVSKKKYTRKIKKRTEEAETKSSAWDLKKCLNSHKSSNSQAMRGSYVYRSFFFSDHSIKQIDSLLPWVCSVIDHRGRQNMVKTSGTHSPQPLPCFYNILTSSVIYY